MAPQPPQRGDGQKLHCFPSVGDGLWLHCFPEEGMGNGSRASPGWGMGYVWDGCVREGRPPPYVFLGGGWGLKGQPPYVFLGGGLSPKKDGGLSCAQSCRSVSLRETAGGLSLSLVEVGVSEWGKSHCQ